MIAAVSRRRRLLKLKAIEYKGGACERCSYNKFPGALDLHHIDPTNKSFALGKSGYSQSWEKIKAELDKCILVCANCHREIEWLENRK